MMAAETPTERRVAGRHPPSRLGVLAFLTKPVDIGSIHRLFTAAVVIPCRVGAEGHGASV